MNAIKKLLGIIARLLLAAGAERWKQGPTLKIQSLASRAEAGTVPAVTDIVTPEKYDAPIIVDRSAVVVTSESPHTVVEVVQPDYKPAASASKAGWNAWLVVLALAGNALLDAFMAPGTLESLPLPTWLLEAAPVPVIYAALALLRDWLRHKDAKA